MIILAEKDFNILDIILNLIEKNKELEKGNRSLMESRKKWKNRYYKEKRKNKEYINKIREKIAEGKYALEVDVLEELLEEK